MGMLLPAQCLWCVHHGHVVACPMFVVCASWACCCLPNGKSGYYLAGPYHMISLLEKCTKLSDLSVGTLDVLIAWNIDVV